jgi:chromosome segregation ATPase
MEVEDFPEEDVMLFQAIRPDYGREDIRKIVVVLKQRRSRLAKRQQSIESELQRVRTELERQSMRLDELDAKGNTSDSRPKPKWFKAVGHIGEGALLTIGDISLALGVLPMHVSVETASWGAIVSATAGIGKIFDGFGELCGE